MYGTSCSYKTIALRPIIDILYHWSLLLHYNMSQLTGGAWVNPWYNRTAGYPSPGNRSILALASVVAWNQTTDPNYGFTKQKVDYFRNTAKVPKILISFGGSNTPANFWTSMAQDPATYSSKIIDFLTNIGADGIDYDYETELSVQTSTGLTEIMKTVGAKGFTQTISVLGGSYDLYKPIIDAGVVDNIIVMCYDGSGMFTKARPSGGLGWEGWMDIWKDKVGADHISKLTIGMIVQVNQSVQYYANEDMVKEGKIYCQTNGMGGIFFWWYSSDVLVSATDSIGPLIDIVES